MKLIEIAASVASLISLFLTIWFPWENPVAGNRNIALSATILFIAITVFLHIVSRRRKSSGNKNSLPDKEITKFTRDLEITNLTKEEIEVFYPKKFLSPPNLIISLVSGKVEINITEQRSDGFKFKTGSGFWTGRTGLCIEWTAEGELEK